MKLNMRIILITCNLILLVLIIASCKKDDLSASAIVLNAGSPAADGCGWLIKINNTNTVYSPVNLNEGYKIDSLKINIHYKILKTKFECGDLPNNGVTQIQLDKISKQ
jgi:hypothetical protein